MTKADTTKILHTEKGEGQKKRTKRVKEFSNNFKNKDSAKAFRAADFNENKSGTEIYKES